jgi:murein DD-endopeptidase MepM/ murein hydrolase activator NlpD
VTAALAERTAARRAARDELVAREHALVDARAGKASLLASVREERHEDEEDLEEMLAASAEIAATIQAAQAAAAAAQGAPTVGSGTAPAGGFVWPVQGVLTSGFGPRWGRMHEGIDIGAPGGTPIVAAAAGTIIYAGWLGGYGNLTLIDHGDGVATAYGHQSAFTVTSGPVSQGQVIGAVGSTGNSTGDHLHFEVRINGGAVDPLLYL